MRAILAMSLIGLVGLTTPFASAREPQTDEAGARERSRYETVETVASAGNYPQRKTDPWRVTRRTLQGGLQQGVEVIEVDNGRLQFSVIPTRGMSLLEARCEDVVLGWDSPVDQIVHPQFIDLNDHGGLGWLAGFNEMMVRCGVSFAGHPGEDDGKLLTLHGRVGNLPASDVDVVIDEAPPYRIRVRGKIEEKMFKFGVFELWTEVSTEPGSQTVRIEDRLVNRSGYAQEYQMIYHTNFGRTLLEEGATFVGPVASVAPFDAYAAEDLDSYETYRGPTPNYGEQVYCLTLNADAEHRTTVMLRNAAADRGVALQYDTRTLPFFTLWKNTDTEQDGYVTGLEPGTGFPYNRAVEREAGRVPKLGAGESVSFRVEIEALLDADAVARIGERISALQAGRQTRQETEPPRQ